MALSKDEVINIVKGFVSISSQRHDIRGAYIFGSFARGTAKDHSDIDVAVVIGQSRESADSLFDEDFQIFHEAQNYDSLLEVVTFPQDVFERGGESIIRRIKKEGVRVM